MSINIEVIISIALGIATLIGTFLSFYFQTKAKLQKAAVEAIDEAEVPGIVGAEKLEAAINQVIGLVPVFLKPFIPRSLVEAIVQGAFDKIADFASKQHKKASENVDVED